MSLDERLPTLLGREAEHADAAPPTMEGVRAAVARRTRHRRRQRLAGSAAALLCVVGGVAGGLALAPWGGGDEDGIATPTEPLPTVPLFGVDLAGLTLTDADTGPFGENDTGGQLAYSVFTEPDGGLDGPVLSVGIEPDSEGYTLTDEDGVPIDLDGDGVAAGPDDGRLLTSAGGLSVTWLTGDGLRAGAGSLGVDQATLLEYVSGLDRLTLDVRSAPAPPGLSHRELLTIPSEQGAEQAYAQYEGLGGTLVLLVTNAPGFFDLSRLGAAHDSEGGVEQIALGVSPLGTGVALVATDQNTTTAVALTDAGLAVQITAIDVDTDVVRDLLAGGRFVEIQPTDPPSTTTTILDRPATPPTSVVSEEDTRITDIRLASHDEFDRVVIEFATAFPERREVTTSARPAQGECVAPDLDGTAFVNLHIGLTDTIGEPGYPGFISGAPEGPVQAIQLACGFEAFVDIAIQLAEPREPEVSELQNPPRLVIDVPR